jgi:hypothetical protein
LSRPIIGLALPEHYDAELDYGVLAWRSSGADRDQKRHGHLLRVLQAGA